MANKKVILSSKFGAIVESIAVYGTIGMVRVPKAKQRTLVEIGDEIVEETKRLVDEPAVSGRGRNRGGLPGYVRGGRRNPDYDFRRRRTAAGSPTYRSSVSSDVTKIRGKLVVVVRNDHPHAEDVEDGTRRLGDAVSSRKYMAIPITKRAYNRMQRNRNLSRSQRRARGWPSAQKGAEWNRQKKRDYLRGIRNKDGSLRRGGDFRGSAIKLSQGRRSQNRSFPGMYLDGRPALFVRTRKNYDGYDILQRAIRNVMKRRGY